MDKQWGDFGNLGFYVILDVRLSTRFEMFFEIASLSRGDLNFTEIKHISWINRKLYSSIYCHLTNYVLINKLSTISRILQWRWIKQVHMDLRIGYFTSKSVGFSSCSPRKIASICLGVSSFQSEISSFSHIM